MIFLIALLAFAFGCRASSYVFKLDACVNVLLSAFIAVGELRGQDLGGLGLLVVPIGLVIADFVLSTIAEERF